MKSRNINLLEVQSFDMLEDSCRCLQIMNTMVDKNNIKE